MSDREQVLANVSPDLRDLLVQRDRLFKQMHDEGERLRIALQDLAALMEEAQEQKADTDDRPARAANGFDPGLGRE